MHPSVYIAKGNISTKSKNKPQLLKKEIGTGYVKEDLMLTFKRFPFLKVQFLYLNIYCKFCPPEMRSETSRAPMSAEVPAQRKTLRPLKTFRAIAQSLFKKTPSTVAASKTMGKLTDVFPEYKYKDVYYNGGKPQTMNYNGPWQGEFDSTLVSKNGRIKFRFINYESQCCVFSFNVLLY